MICRFEDRLAGRAMRMEGLLTRIEARHVHELTACFDAIEAARRQGHWIAVLLDYELGEWLLPEATRAPPTGAPVESRVDDGHARLTALVFDRMIEETPWPDAPPAAHATIDSVTSEQSQEDYLRTIEQIRELIANGELYQLNYTQPLHVKTSAPPQSLYRHIASRHPVAHAAYIEDVGRTVLSFSPELFLTRRGTRLTARPMKGTAPRHSDPQEDTRLGQELLASAKNRAENLMIVDLLRNDLGRLAKTGSVKVDALFDLERYPSVWTMTSTVSADVPHASFSDILHALFPCGSITGAPKIAAMRRIRQLELAPRWLYCGSLGWLAPNGDFSLNVAIRTLVLNQSGNGVYSVGGGIVHDSDPLQEWHESHWKARLLQPSS